LFHLYGNPGCAEQANIDDDFCPSGVLSKRTISHPRALSAAKADQILFALSLLMIAVHPHCRY
jgi:hypothetical protein